MAIRSNISHRILTVVLLVVLVFSGHTFGQTESTWIGGSGNWSDPANWDNGVPVGFAIAVFRDGAGEINQDIGDLALFGLEIDNPDVNLGLENGIVVQQSLLWNSGTISGKSSLQLESVAEINGGELQTTFENLGHVDFGTNGNFTVLRSETGGTWINRAGSSANSLSGLLIGSFPDNGLGDIIIEPGSIFRVAGNTFQTSWNFQNDGQIILETFSFFFADYVQSPKAELELNSGGADFFQESELFGTVTGSGSIGNLMGPFDVQFEPGGDQIGNVTSFGAMIMTPDTVSNFQIGPNLTSDRLFNSGGPLQLDGVLNIEALPGATTGNYELFSYNNASSLEVDAIQLGCVPNGFDGFLQNDLTEQTVCLVVTAIDPVILGDVNLDGVVNLLDVAPLVELLISNVFQVEADVNVDGVVNLLDVSGFVAILNGQ